MFIFLKLSCQIPGLANDTYEIADSIHLELVKTFIPPPKSKSFTSDYDKCNIKVYSGNDSDSYTLEKCQKWVYSKKYFGETLASKVGLQINLNYFLVSKKKMNETKSLE